MSPGLGSIARKDACFVSLTSYEEKNSRKTDPLHNLRSIRSIDDCDVTFSCFTSFSIGSRQLFSSYPDVDGRFGAAVARSPYIERSEKNEEAIFFVRLWFFEQIWSVVKILHNFLYWLLLLPDNIFLCLALLSSSFIRVKVFFCFMQIILI